MNRKSKNLLTFMLAGALCAATIGGTTALTRVNADENDPETYALTEVFGASSNSMSLISAEKVTNEDEEQTAKFNFVKDSWVAYEHDLAIKWYEGKNDARYLNFDFAFVNKNFTDLSFKFEVTPAHAVEDGVAINTIKFKKVSETEVKVAVYAGEKEPETLEGETVAIAENMSVELDEGENYGEFKVKVNDTEVGVMTNVGANFADTAAESTSGSKIKPLVMSATPEDATEDFAIYFSSLNGQSFDNITGDTTKMVEDDAAPVLVVKQDVSGFLLGTAFSLEYEKIDVLKSSGLTETKEYYQYNPADTKIEMKTLTTSTYFMDTVYYKNEAGEFSKEAKEGFTATSVYRETEKEKGIGEEYVSITFNLKDGSFEKAYELSWYATETVEKEISLTESTDKRDYIVLNRNDEGPVYKQIIANGETKENEVTSDLEGLVKDYQEKLQKEADKVLAGSNAELLLGNSLGLDWLIGDNNGYSALQFTISYRTPSSPTPSTLPNKKSSALEIPTASEGFYEFKVFATDAAGNAMKYYLDEELVDVGSSNIWEIEEIPSFKFEVKNKGIEAKEDNDTLDSKILDQTYSMPSVTIVGIGSEEDSNYQLYKFKDTIWDLDPNAAEILSKITFAELNDTADKLVDEEGSLSLSKDDYMEFYKKAFLELAAKKLDKTYAEVANCLDDEAKIDPYNSAITEDDEEAWENSHNKYNWKDGSFTCADEGLYLLIVDYWDKELATIDRVPVYQLIEVAEEADSIKGQSKWLENNLTSIILFSIAGVLGVAILVLLFVNPSDETLADVDKKAAKKKAAKK